MSSPSWPRAIRTSPYLRTIQASQLCVAALSLVFVIIAPWSSSARTRFTYSLLYSLIGTAITTSGFILAEHYAALMGFLTKERYGYYQLCKFVAASIIYILGFIIFVKTQFAPKETKSIWVSDMMAGAYPFHVMILVLHLFNWIFLWAGTLYCCAMSEIEQGGQIRLADDEAPIALEPEELDETMDDEAIARELQAQEPEWQA